PLTAGPQTIRLQPGTKITGRITDGQTGRGLANMSVAVQTVGPSVTSNETRTDADGRYALRILLPQVRLFGGGRGAPLPRGAARLHVSNPTGLDTPSSDYWPAEEERDVAVKEDDDEIRDIDFQFDPTIPLRGTIRMEDDSSPPIRLTLPAIAI